MDGAGAGGRILPACLALLVLLTGPVAASGQTDNPAANPAANPVNNPAVNYAVKTADNPASDAATARADTDTLGALAIKKNGWLAAGEVVGVNLLIWSYNRFLREGGENPGFRVGSQSWKTNILNGFEWDDNSFATNQFAHPYHGSLYYNAARSNGFSYWESMPFAFGGSWIWEHLCETHHPSINDWVATSIGGIALGETFHRFSDMIFDNTATGSGRFWREVGGFVVNPMRGLNRLISGRAFEQQANPPGRFPGSQLGNFEVGIRTTGDDYVWRSDTTRVYIEFDYFYGDPFGQDNRKPFDSFDFTLQINFNDKSGIGRMQAKGLLFAADLEQSERTHHILAAYQHYDYFNNWAFEFGGQSVSASYLSNIEVGRSRLHTEFHADGLILGGTKSDYESFTGRSYDYGPGLGFKLMTSLIRDERPFFTLGHNNYWIHVLNGNSGDHFLTFTWARLDIRLREFFGLGIEYNLYTADRHYAEFPDVHQRTPEIKAFLSWMGY